MAMSYLVAVPEYVAAAATDLANIGSTITAANTAAAGPTSGVLAAGADEISTAVASLFSQHARAFQALGAQAASFHQQFVQLMNVGAGQYASAEAANASPLQNLAQELQAAVNAPVQKLLGSTPIGGLNTLLSGGLSKLNLGSNLNLGGLANVPYNLFADVVNMPYYESLALQEYAFALGPAGSVGGVPGWIPPGATLANGGVKMVNGLPYYALGGTGSWYMESIGNTWGWDDGNWPQVDALLHVVLPFQFTETIAEQVQTFAQAELIDGAHVNTEFQGGNPLAYLGGWLHGATPISSLLSGTTFPSTLTDTVGQNVGSVINVGPNPPGTDLAIWAGEPAKLTIGAEWQAVAANLTASPAQNPIMLPDPAGVVSNAALLGNDFLTNFNPFVTGSFLYWGAPTDYSIPSAIGGTIQDFTGIPNQFPLANFGAEPVSGYTTTPSSLLTGIPEGEQYLVQGLQGYLNPNTYLEAVSNDIAVLSDPLAHLGGVPLIGYLGLG
jgi:PE family